MPYAYADLVYDDNGRPSVLRESESKTMLQTEDTILVSEERIEVEADYRDRHGREAVVRGWVSLPAIVRTADVKRGPDGLPMRRPLTGTRPTLLPWERFVGDPTYVINDGEVLKQWHKEQIPIDEWRTQHVADIEGLAVRRLGELVPPYRRLIAVDDPANVKAAEGLRALVVEATEGIYAAKSHAAVAEVAAGASALLREFAL